MTGIEEYTAILENLINIFTVEKGVLKVLLMRKKSDPYKGYWILPTNIVTNKETLEENVLSTIKELKLPKMYIEQGYIFSDLDRDPAERIVGISHIGLVDYSTYKIKTGKRDDLDLAWFNIDDIPKMGYDHQKIVKKAIELLRKKLVNSEILKYLFPSDFTLPEIQKVYEQILGYQLDRRNFRKKFVNLGIVIDTGDKNVSTNGRPGKLYRFNEDFKERNLF